MMADNENRDDGLDLLLPWYVNGTLSAEERRQVEAYLERSGRARDEVDLLRALRQQVKDEAVENSPGELGLQRLKREIKQADQAPAGGDRMAGRTISIASFWRPLAAAACLVVVVQAGVMVGLRTGTIDPGTVGIASGTTGLSAPVLQVTFAPDATEEQIRELLQSAGASIAEGPTALGIYQLRLLDAESTSIDEALTTLRANGDVVTFAERN
jgi:anti-sigma-K factor RskA